MVTLHDIAQLAGVSASTVSRALRGDSGISRKTRDKVLSAAETLNYDHSPSLKDIAVRAGVSLSTASNVLNGRAAGPGSRQAVLKAAAELDYRPKVKTANPVQKEILYVASHSPLDMINSIYSTAASLGYHVTYMPTGQTSDDSCIRQLESGQASGIIFFNSISLDLMRHCAARYPTIQLGIYDDVPGSHIVTIDYEQASFELTTELLDQKKSKIRMLVSLTGNSTPFNRYAEFYLQGAKRAIAARGLPASHLEVVDLGPNGTNGDFNFHSRHINQMLAIDAEKRPDALLCMNGRLASTVVNLLVLSGVNVPDDIAVASFLGGAHDKHCKPFLSSLQPPSRNLGSEAVHVIVDLIERTRPRPVSMYFQHHIRYGGSTRRELYPYGFSDQM